MSQKDKVLEKLELDGFVSNLWAIENYILRLGAIIYKLRQEGYQIRSEWGEGKERRNMYYYLDDKDKNSSSRENLYQQDLQRDSLDSSATARGAVPISAFTAQRRKDFQLSNQDKLQIHF